MAHHQKSLTFGATAMAGGGTLLMPSGMSFVLTQGVDEFAIYTGGEGRILSPSSQMEESRASVIRC